ncbi:hypothetical protein L3Q67_28505 [Saccharothrix sp. AJ9571]|nr:hypothetical protein L3Q67_28505 [Saccharothrix sp. AJ9571]
MFGTEWLRQLQRVLVLEQRFVNLIGAHAEAVKNASAMYAHADVNARKALQSILEEM